jgi:hypothetical protein
MSSKRSKITPLSVVSVQQKNDGQEREGANQDPESASSDDTVQEPVDFLQTEVAVIGQLRHPGRVRRRRLDPSHLDSEPVDFLQALKLVIARGWEQLRVGGHCREWRLLKISPSGKRATWLAP